MSVKEIFEVMMATPGVPILMAALIPLLVSGILMCALKSKRGRRVCAVVFALCAAVSAVGLVQGVRDSEAQDRMLLEDPLVAQLAEYVVDHSGSSFSEGGRAGVREPWLILHVDHDTSKSRKASFKLSDVMYSGVHLTREALDEVQTICLWYTKPWESATYVGNGGATVRCSSQKASCWIYDVQANAFTETFTVYSQALPEKVSTGGTFKVRPAQVRECLLDRLAAP